MAFCENVITLERVYWDSGGIHLVMRFAEHGSMLKYIAEKANEGGI